MGNKILKVKPSSYDRRDRLYHSENIKLSGAVDLREYATAVEDQQDLGSCVASATVSAYELLLKKNFPDRLVELSKLYTYWHARLLEGSEMFDDGVEEIRTAIKGAAKFGICNEQLWPYQEEMVTYQPGIDCYVDAWPRKISSYTSLPSIGGMLEVLSQGFPIVIGLTIYDNFFTLTPQNPVLGMPTGPVVLPQGHAVCLVGYSVSSRWFIAKNSFGTEWGEEGYCYIPFDYINQYAFDRWYFKIYDL